MIDPLTQLAFSGYSGKGIYALLLGSGISRAAGIPTGWEVTLDLIGKLAAANGESCGPDPALWYRQKYGAEPTYSAVLENMAITPSERTNALAAYFEATPAEREQGLKSPTKAHQAIARLISKGYFKVVVTTNFDRLMEQALEAEGISPTVISTPDMVRGAMPLAHATCTVIKIHGDYRDIRIKNTDGELGEYSPETNALLDRVFDEYGLIICGWSATWDPALRAAIFRCPNRRFSVFWGMKEAPSSEATEIINFRQVSSIEIESADTLFCNLEEKIESLERFNRPHPLSTPIAVASLKRFIPEERFRIDLRELVMNEVERQIKILAPLPVNVTNARNHASQNQYLQRAEFYEASMEMLVSLIANGCFYGTADQSTIWRDAILRVTNLWTSQGGSSHLLQLRLYPACLLTYAGGLASVASKNYGTLRAILRDAKTIVPISFEGQQLELIRNIVPGTVMGGLRANHDWHAPASDRLHTLLRDPLRSLIPGDPDYDSVFNRFECLFTLVHYDFQSLEKQNDPQWAPVGRFIWQDRGISDLLAKENKAERENWGPIKAGLFSNSARFERLSDAYRSNVLSRIPAY